MASAALKNTCTPQEYLALERQAEFKSEYLNGVIVAVAGANRHHSLITGNISQSISNQLARRPRETYSSNMRVLVNRTGLYAYPDVFVVCGEPRFEDSEVDTLLNPTVIVEVFSPTTESLDPGKKFTHYRQLESLREFVIVADDEILVERYLRRGDEWIFTDFRHLDDTLSLTSIDCHVPLREIYARIEFPDVSPSTAAT
jgi:Uma2 family endonuclease